MSYLYAQLSPFNGGLSYTLLSSGFSSYGWQLFVLIVVCGFLVVGTIYLSKYLARTRLNMRSDSNLQTIEVIGVGMNQTVQLMRAGKKYFIIGVSKDRIVYLTDVDETDLEFEQVAERAPKGTFNQYLQRFLNKTDAPEPKNKDGTGDDNDNDEN